MQGWIHSIFGTRALQSWGNAEPGRVGNTLHPKASAASQMRLGLGVPHCAEDRRLSRALLSSAPLLPCRAGVLMPC